MPRTPTRKERIFARMVELSTGEAWAHVPGAVGYTVRRTQEHPTPAHARTGWAGWNEDTYSSHVFVTLVAGKFILGTSAAPWMGRQDQDCPLWLVELILEDPELAHDTTRKLELRAQRKVKS